MDLVTHDEGRIERRKATLFLRPKVVKYAAAAGAVRTSRSWQRLERAGKRGALRDHPFHAASRRRSRKVTTGFVHSKIRHTEAALLRELLQTPIEIDVTYADSSDTERQNYIGHGNDRGTFDESNLDTSSPSRSSRQESGNDFRNDNNGNRGSF
jgi:hypothetical protein